MKYFLPPFIFLFFSLFFNFSYAEDALTIKQQLNRVIEEVSDLNKAVFNKSFDKTNLYSSNKENDVERFTSIDIRIYDLEKDIKNLTLQFEEILFKLEDISKNINSLEIKSKKIDQNIKKDTFEKTSVQEENTLGKIIISDTKKNVTNVDAENLIDKEKKDKKSEDQLSQDLNKMSPENQLQFALDQMRKRNFDVSKKTLENFVIRFPDNQISGSAYFWLGKIYLFEMDYRKAVFVLGEGVQKFPKSIKVGEMYYELIKSLIYLDKIAEACKTFKLFKENYKEDKFAKDPDKIVKNLSCEKLN